MMRDRTNVFDKSVILIGPMGVGKTTAAKEIAKILDMPYIDVDELRWEYFNRQPDYDGQMVEELFNSGKETEAFRYMKPFEARFSVDLLERQMYGVFDFGAGYSVYEDAALFDKVRAAFAKYKQVIYLRYSDDTAESIEALRDRHEEIPDDLYHFLNEGFVKSPCNEALATYIVDTKGKTAESVIETVLTKIHSK